MVELWWSNSVALQKETFCKSGVKATMRTRFSSGRGLGCLGLAMEHNLLNIIIDIRVCTGFKTLKVKVPIIFFGTQGFSAHRDGPFISPTLCSPYIPHFPNFSTSCHTNINRYE